ncbi:hypothetical protein MKW98_011891 [Papaver atlanticum]|uniref:Aminotransferase-like plant mobile domain-containing protein n=1 Tax=Papaver atlanticum TaxID=357466 RepID=A0AAD4T5V3_9MAGN|nr:hypothetical protein MKW98_011891 [Papaver atlanticum]
MEESDNASGSDTVEEIVSEENSYEDDNKDGNEFDEESSDEEDEENLGEADVGRDSSSEKGKKAVEASEIPGKPINPRLLSYYRDHIARLVWENEYGHDKIDRALINAFRERWYPETNTYHLPFSEMTITIEDVERITILDAKGEVVEGVFGAKTMTWDYMYDLIKRTLGKTKKELEIEKAFGGTAKKLERKLKLNWLRKKFTNKKNDSKKRKEQSSMWNLLEHVYALHRYLLYVIGSIVYGDKSGLRVNAHFLQCLENLDKVNSYSWATACLDWIYHHLGQGSRRFPLTSLPLYDHAFVLFCFSQTRSEHEHVRSRKNSAHERSNLRSCHVSSLSIVYLGMSTLNSTCCNVIEMFNVIGPSRNKLLFIWA